jgi:uncharacterized damage-inducible protein DinB
MGELGILRGWFAYNDRARLGYLDTISRLPSEELARERGASFPTIPAILTHSIEAISFWIESASVVLGPTFPSVEHPEPPTLDDLLTFERQVREETRRFLDRLTDTDLDRTFTVGPSSSFPTVLEVTVRDMLWHLVEEELQHRGELNALLWQIDVEAPIYDWIDWVKESRRTN